MADGVTVIQATLAPSFLISGTTILLNFTQARLFRVVDRLRGQYPEERPRLQRRALILRNAIAFGVLTVALTVATAILLMAGAVFERPFLADAAPYVFGSALLALFAALLLVLFDTTESVRSVTAPDPAKP